MLNAVDALMLRPVIHKGAADILHIGDQLDIGNEYRYNDNSAMRLSFKYRNRTSTFNPKHKIILHKGLWKALNVNY